MSGEKKSTAKLKARKVLKKPLINQTKTNKQSRY